MKWMRFRIRTNPASEDRMIAAMMEIGLTGAQIEDKVPLTAAEKEQIYTFDIEDPVDDGIAYVSFFAEADEGNRLKVTLPDGREVTRSPEKLQEEIQAVLSTLREGGDIGDGTLSLSLTEDIDWMNNWKQYFHHFYLDGDILVIPSWEKLRKEDTAGAKYILHMDPGTAFGTGAHETTQLAQRMIRKYLKKGDRLLDVGTGSGVLGILALMFGARQVTGTDLDPFCAEAVRQNLVNNGFPPPDLRDYRSSREKKRFHLEEQAREGASFRLVLGNVIGDSVVQDAVGTQCYDLVVANILPVVLVPLTPEIPRYLKDGGIYITSGILTERMEELKRCHEEAGLTVIETQTQGEWCTVVSRKENAKEGA